MITTIICTYNRSEILQQTLLSIEEMAKNIDFPWELVIIDNNSSDNTAQVVNRFCQTSGLNNVRYIVETRQGTSHARNRGVTEARGEIIAFTDDDVLVEKDWLAKIRQFYQTYDCDVVAGKILPLYPPDTPQWIKENENIISGPLVKYDCGNTIQLLESIAGGCPGTANMACKKTCFMELGFFNTNLGLGTGMRGEDEEFLTRLLNHNKTIYYNGELVVWHPVLKHRMTYKYIAEWYFGAGRYMIREYKTIQGNPPILLGIPRYLIKAIIKHALLFMVNTLNRRQSLLHWQTMARYAGMCYEYKIAKRF